MRHVFASLVLVSACTVPDKHPSTGDGGVDAPVDPNATPNTVITSAPDEFSNSGTATFEFESDQPRATFTCSVDGEPPAACTSPFVRALPDGTHSFSVRAVSPSGDGDDTPAEHLWSIDTIAPITTLTQTPPALDNSTMVQFSFMSNEMFATFECSLDSAAFVSCRTGDTFGPIGDGPHSFAVRARDRAGNVDASPAVHAWQVDTSTPDTTITAGPSGAVASTAATFEFLSPDAGPGATFECSLDGSPFAACTSPASYAGLAMGVHTFSVRVRDANGNYDPTPAMRTWTADSTPPETTIISAPSGTVAMASAIISFTANEDVTYACSLDGAAYTPCTSPFSALNLAQGGHTFSVIATDMAGNADASPAMAAWVVDTTTPEIMIVSGPADAGTSGPYIVFGFTVNEGTPECSLNGGAFAPCTSPFDYNQAAGAASFAVRASDSAGNSTTVTRSFTIECAAPDVTGASGLLRFEDNAQTLANATGGASATLGSTLDPEPNDPAFTTGRFGLGLAFNTAEQDTVLWPITLGAQSSLVVEQWLQPAALAGTREILSNGDGSFVLRATLTSATTIVFAGTVTDLSGVEYTVASNPVTAGQWHLVALSFGPTLSLFVDGDAYSTPNARAAVSVDSLVWASTYGGLVDEAWVGTAGYDPLPRYCPVAGIRL